MASADFVVALVACPVEGRGAGASRLAGALRLRLEPGSRLARAYGALVAEERFTCNYELNPRYRAALEQSGLRFSAFNERGEARACELEGHPFFVGTLFQPQLSSAPGTPHPLIAAFVEAARGSR